MWLDVPRLSRPLAGWRRTRCRRRSSGSGRTRRMRRWQQQQWAPWLCWPPWPSARCWWWTRPGSCRTPAPTCAASWCGSVRSSSGGTWPPSRCRRAGTWPCTPPWGCRAGWRGSAAWGRAGGCREPELRGAGRSRAAGELGPCWLLGPGPAGPLLAAALARPSAALGC